MLKALKHRQRQDEWMDHPSVAPGDLEASLRFIRGINRFLGYTRITLGYFRRFSRQWDQSEMIHVLDLATGSADVPEALLRWARKAGFKVRVVGLDMHPLTSAIAARGKHSDLRIVRGDAMLAPFADQSFDYVMTNMFVHHLDDAEVVQVLREMSRIARRGIVAADLLRTRRAYAWIWLITLFSRSMVRHDGRASVRQAFSFQEITALTCRAHLSFAQVKKHFGHRFVLAGEKSATT
jgi:ubiquinone/menaquinone biosynthesis C-methylase UbiE